MFNGLKFKKDNKLKLISLNKNFLLKLMQFFFNECFPFWREMNRIQIPPCAIKL